MKPSSTARLDIIDALLGPLDRCKPIIASCGSDDLSVGVVSGEIFRIYVCCGVKIVDSARKAGGTLHLILQKGGR